VQAALHQELTLGLANEFDAPGCRLFAVQHTLARREEALIERAASDGLEVLRRPDASPVAVLGIEVRRRE
jgi:hypothetical protein